MKQAILFLVIFAFGAVSYALIQKFTITAPIAVQTDAVQTATTTVPSQATDASDTEEQTIVTIEDTITIAPDGTQLDGPFVIFDESGQKTEGTVEIIRSPSEILLHFENFEGIPSVASHVYLADDLEANNYLDLSPARFTEGVDVYGIPLDADLESYAYILIFDRQLEQTEYYARIR